MNPKTAMKDREMNQNENCLEASHIKCLILLALPNMWQHYIDSVFRWVTYIN